MPRSRRKWTCVSISDKSIKAVDQKEDRENNGEELEHCMTSKRGSNFKYKDELEVPLIYLWKG